MEKSPRVAQFMFLNQSYNKFGYQQGISIVEILVIIAIIGIALASLLGLATFSLKASTSIKETTQANSLAQEVMEGVRNFRDGIAWDSNGLGTLTADVAYYPQKTVDIPPEWQLIQDEEQIDGFTRKAVFTDVQRDGNDNIVETGGTNDPNTKKVTVTVFWENKKVEIITYLTNWKQ